MSVRRLDNGELEYRWVENGKQRVETQGRIVHIRLRRFTAWWPVNAFIWPSGVWYGASHRPGGFGYIPQRCPPKRHPEHQRQPDRRTKRGCRKSFAGEVSRFVARSEERRLGEACASKCRSRWSQYNSTQQKTQ